ncbi:MAG: GNAT family N-acetyltransferase [Solobacterium sp.]|jgi:predicted acetyltransferase|nr:GNAT family N-acetyltransferase [Solobacterium sp.]MCH4222823.1 GNAT family N-acetyltransferase [Solobacterium sp.]MCH4266294.1 GNAT family N-acetyltransferase [Solobacterium sp.]
MFDWLIHKQKTNRITGPIVDLAVDQKVAADWQNQYVPSVTYKIYRHGTDQEVGTCDIRLGMNKELYYAGNIGYHINLNERGHGYAYEACVLLFQIARDEYCMDQLIITCSPDNVASRKTLEKLNGKFLETVDVPIDHWLYRRGETVKNIYEYTLLE